MAGWPCSRNNKNQENFPLLRGRTLKKEQFSISSLTFPENRILYATLEDDSGFGLSNCDHIRRSCTNRSDDRLKVIHNVNTCFRRAVGYRTNWLDNKSSKHEKDIFMNINKMLKRMTIQMKPPTFGSFDPISIFEILCNFNLACDTSGIHE